MVSLHLPILNNKRPSIVSIGNWFFAVTCKHSHEFLLFAVAYWSLCSSTHCKLVQFLFVHFFVYTRLGRFHQSEMLSTGILITWLWALSIHNMETYVHWRPLFQPDWHKHHRYLQQKLPLSATVLVVAILAATANMIVAKVTINDDSTASSMKWKRIDCKEKKERKRWWGNGWGLVNYTFPNGNMSQCHLDLTNQSISWIWH